MAQTSATTDRNDLDLSPLPFLEKTLPIGALILSVHFILMAENKLAVSLVCASFVAVNVLWSKLLHNKNDVLPRIGEGVKVLVNSLGIVLATVLLEVKEPIWLFHLLYIFRLPLAVSTKWERILFLELLAVGACLSLFFIDAGASSILPFGLIHCVYVLSSTFISFLENNLKEKISLLQKSEQQYFDLYENAPDMLCSIDAKTATVKSCNYTLVKTLGYSEKDEVIGLQIFDIYHEDCHPEVKKAFKQFQEKGMVRHEHLILKKKEGSKLHVSLKVSAVKDANGNVLSSRSSWRDITPLKEAEEKLIELNNSLEQKVTERTRDLYYVNEKLKEKNAEFEGVFQAFPDLLFRLEEDGTIYGYEANKDDLYVDPSVFIGNKMHEVLPPEVGSMFSHSLEAIQKTRTRQQISYELEINDEVRSFEARLLPFSTDKVLTIVRDITEKVRTEKELEHSRAKSLLQSKMASLGLMAGGIAHEINNPLSIISAHLNMLKIKAENGDVPQDDVRKTAERVDHTVNRISNIIGGLQRISRDDSKQELTPIRVGQILEDTVSLCRERFKNHGIEFEISCSCESTYIMCRETEISQVLLNLLNNSFDAVEDVERKVVGIQVEKTEDGFVEFQVEDTGTGIDETHKKKVFDPFFTTKSVGKGTGLGLSICKGIVENHSGYMRFSSGESTKFIFGIKQSKNAFSEEKKAA